MNARAQESLKNPQDLPFKSATRSLSYKGSATQLRCDTSLAEGLELTKTQKQTVGVISNFAQACKQWCLITPRFDFLISLNILKPRERYEIFLL